MENRFFITTSIAYANAAPHIGFVLELLQADVLARYARQKGLRVFFQTGTDEHGSKIARAAEAAGVSPQKFVDQNAKKFQELKNAFNISWNAFVRTTDREKHWPIVEEIWKKLEKSGDLYKKSYEGLYCVGHEAFITEKDLVDGKCPDHQTKPELISEENWHFRLSKYTEVLKKKIKNDELKIVPETRKNEILALLQRGLEDVSFSRPAKALSWGVPVPGDDSHTIYVWADALVNYLDNKEWWPASVQIIGKDISRFHAAIWPAMLISAGLPLPKTLLVHGFITVGGQKISKSVGNVINPFELLAKYGSEAARYYLLREIPTTEDGDFTYEKFEARYNGDLANGLGNFAARVLTLGQNLSLASGDAEKLIDPAVDEKIKEAKKEIAAKLETFKINEALGILWELIGFGDKYVNDNEPWKTKDKKVIFNAVVILDNIAFLLELFLPETAKKIKENITWKSDNTLEVKKSQPLFPRI